jgi:hypothetical protein
MKVHGYKIIMSELSDWLAENESTRKILASQLQEIIDRTKLSYPKEVFNSLVKYRHLMIELLDDWSPLCESKDVIIYILECTMNEIQWQDTGEIYNRLIEFKNLMQQLL